jgi:hypothetical protein
MSERPAPYSTSKVTPEQQQIVDEIHRRAERFTLAVIRAQDLGLEVEVEYAYMGRQFSGIDRYQLQARVSVPEPKQPDRTIRPSPNFRDGGGHS